MILMGHRGAKEQLPENSLLGFQKVIEKGLKAIELDIHLSSDEEIVVIHDDTVNRTTNGEGPVSGKSLSELKALDLGEGQTIPTLKEALDLISKENVVTQIEIKDPNVLGPLTKMIGDYPAELLTVISFDHKVLMSFKEACPYIKTACLMYGLPVNPVQIIKDCKADGISLSVHLIDKEVVEQCHQAGLSVTAWNANDKEAVERFREMGVDYLGTDYPLDLF
ncbi:MAG: glycerophosphodiester phosphodiesterase [Oligoflexia bacterium]|nr:glycerophosphodiester phosphodiesterase [Oligoflexia bacterium]